jgi:hypothetical protein
LLTVIVRTTSAAGSYKALPDCDAVTVQEPAETVVIVAPLAPPDVHAPDAMNVTGFPEAPPVALTVNGGSPYVRSAGAANPMV